MPLQEYSLRVMYVFFFFFFFFFIVCLFVCIFYSISVCVCYIYIRFFFFFFFPGIVLEEVKRHLPKVSFFVFESNFAQFSVFEITNIPNIHKVTQDTYKDKKWLVSRFTYFYRFQPKCQVQTEHGK